jgi:hypothetical protein
MMHELIINQPVIKENYDLKPETLWASLQLSMQSVHITTKIVSTLIVFGWFGVQCVLYVLPVGGELVDGLPVKETGVKLKYRLNAFFVLTLNILGLLAAIVSGFNVTMVSDKLASRE